MTTNSQNYDQLFEGTLHNVVRMVLDRIAEEGLPDDHHFYISFRTGHAGVTIPDHLLNRYPDEMTIVLQNQFWNLKVLDESFEVTLSFNNIQERVIVPFAAITSFVDPSVRFGLQFRGGKERDAATVPSAKTGKDAEILHRKDKNAAKTAENPAESEQTADVIPLDTFRKQ